MAGQRRRGGQMQMRHGKACAHDPNRLLAALAGAIRRGHDHGSAAVRHRRAIEQPQRIGDHVAGAIGREIHRRAHMRIRMRDRGGAVMHGDGAKIAFVGAEVVHVGAGHHGEQRRHGRAERTFDIGMNRAGIGQRVDVGIAGVDAERHVRRNDEDRLGRAAFDHVAGHVDHDRRRGASAFQSQRRRWSDAEIFGEGRGVDQIGVRARRQCQDRVDVAIVRGRRLRAPAGPAARATPSASTPAMRPCTGSAIPAIITLLMSDHIH